MPFMARFRKKKEEDDPLAGIEEALEEGEGDGLLMSTGAQTAETAGEGGQADPTLGLDEATATDAPPQEEGSAEPQVIEDELMAAAQSGPSTSAPAPAPDPSPALEPSADVQPEPMEPAAMPEAPEAAAVPDAPEAVPAADDAVADDEPDTVAPIPAAPGDFQVQTAKVEGETSEASTDDLLSAFRDEAPTGAVGELTKGLDDVPMEELLTGLREMRAMMGVPPSIGDGSAEEAAQE